MFLIDTHCHINHIYDAKNNLDINKILKNAYKKNIKLFLSISTSIQDFYHMFKHTKKKKNIFLSCGLHPNNIHSLHDIERIESIIYKYKKIIAIGETGIDLYKSTIKKKKQIELFNNHIYISKKTQKPLIIHNRLADSEILNILHTKKNQIDASGIIHSFTGTKDIAKKFLDMGLYISFSGIVTFKKSNNLRNILKYIPLDRMLIETDSPYLSPEPCRGKKNQPAFLYYIAKTIQKTLKIDFLKFTQQLKKNFFKLFKINEKFI